MLLMQKSRKTSEIDESQLGGSERGGEVKARGNRGNKKGLQGWVLLDPAILFLRFTRLPDC